VTLASTDWPLTGREHELESIAQALREPGAGGVVIVADAGVGKSRLARAAFAKAERAGAFTAWVQATRSAAAIPLGAFAGLLPDGLESNQAARMMHAGIAAFTERAAGRAIVLAVDDAQLLDAASATLVLHLVTGAAVRVVATVRTGAPLPAAVESLFKDAGAVRLDLGTLGDDAARKLVETALGGVLDEAAAQWLLERSGGNALYLRELLLSALDGGVLEDRAGLWRLVARPALRPTLQELVLSRLEALDAGPREALELLALGEPLGLAELCDLASPDAMSDLEARGLLTVGGDDELRVAHPLFGDAIREALGVLHAHRLRLRLAETLVARDPLTAADALRIVRLRIDAGAEVPDGLRLLAARAANAAGDPDLAARLVSDSGGSVAAAMQLARAHSLRNRHADAETVLAGVEREAASSPEAFDYVWQRIWVLQWGLHDRASAAALVERAAAWPRDGDWAERLAHARREVAFVEGGFTAAGDDHEPPEASRLILPSRRALALLFDGRGDEAAAIARGLRPRVPLRDPADAAALGTVALVAVASGNDWSEVEAFMRATLSSAVRANDHQAAGSAALSLGSFARAAGRYRDARHRLAEAEAHFAHADALGNLVNVHAQQAGVALFTGDRDGVIAAVARMEQVLDGHDPLPNQRFAVLLARGWAARVRSDANAVALWLRAAQESAPWVAAHLLYEALRAGADTAQELSALAASGSTRIVSAFAAHAVARAADDGASQLAAADELLAIGAAAYAVEATADAAAAYMRQGAQDAARRAAARMRELHVPGQGAALPEVAGLDATELTARERQIVDLAVAGRTNAQIAEELVLSVRTVETYVYRAMTKLGVGDRREFRRSD
jgi:DNA-binding NarL/FixJ family response regulator